MDNEITKENLEDTDAFLDVMDTKERKEWAKGKIERMTGSPVHVESRKERKIRMQKERAERLQAKNQRSEEEAEIKIEETGKDASIAEKIEIEPIEVEETPVIEKEPIIEVKEELFEPELVEEIIEKIEKEEKSDLVGLSGSFVILVIGFFVTMFLFTDYNEGSFILINSFFVIFMTLILCVSVLCNRKYARGFSIFNLLVLISCITFNILSIINQ